MASIADIMLLNGDNAIVALDIGLPKTILYYLILFTLVAILVSVKMPKPARAVVVAGYIELTFGALFAVPPTVLLLAYPLSTFTAPAMTTMILLIVAGVLWMIMAVFVLKGNRRARTLSLYLSAIRAMTLVGLVFSLPSAWLLYMPQQARDFFSDVAVQQQPGPQEDSSA